MKLLTFETYEKYIKAQKRTLRRRGIGPYFTDLEIGKICNWLKHEYEQSVGNSSVIYGVCHGARNGLEADEFKKNFIRADVFGTDLFPFSGRSAAHRGKSDVVEYDFSVRNPEWVGMFDFVYTNSLDHARDPIATLVVWMEQLKPGGYLFVQWAATGHVGVKQGDCFGAHLYEYMDLVKNAGVLKELIYSICPIEGYNILRRRALEVVVLVVGKKIETN